MFFVFCYNTNAMKTFNYGKKIYVSFILIIFGIFYFFNTALAVQTVNHRGKIYLQVEHYGEAWYVHPKSGERYYLRDGNEAYNLMRKKSLGISNPDLNKIPKDISEKGDKKIIERLRGYILLQVESRGEAWYVNPTDGMRYYMKDGEAAYEIMKKFGVGIKDADLRKIRMNSEQVVFDQTFDQVAHVKYSGNEFIGSYFSDHILPLASLTKLMTAMVVLQNNPQWEKIITILPEDLHYPKFFVSPDDVTSEIDFKPQDRVSVRDLWNAMLIASSNQAAGLLSKNSGITQQEFIFQMNERAKALGLVKTIFTDPSGLDTFNISTAQEMAKIAQAAFSYPEIEHTTLAHYMISAVQEDGAIREIPVINRNHSLMKFGADSAKTGFLYEAQRNVALKKGDDIIVVLHARSMNERNTIIQKLLEK